MDGTEIAPTVIYARRGLIPDQEDHMIRYRGKRHMGRHSKRK